MASNLFLSAQAKSNERPSKEMHADNRQTGSRARMNRLIPCLLITILLSPPVCFGKKTRVKDVDGNRGTDASLAKSNHHSFDYQFAYLKRLIAKFQIAADDYIDYLSNHEIEISNYATLKKKRLLLVDIAGQMSLGCKSLASAELHGTASQQTEVSSAINGLSEKALFLYRQCTGDSRAIAVQGALTKNIDSTRVRSLPPRTIGDQNELREFLDGKRDVLHGYDAF